MSAKEFYLGDLYLKICQDKLAHLFLQDHALLIISHKLENPLGVMRVIVGCFLFVSKITIG